jgi:3-oxoacyl-[acyl-carrier protein] reductase
MEFENKTIVITGAAGIFGRWIAAYFAAQGATLCLSDVRMNGLEKAVSELGLDRSNVLLHATELTSDASMLDLVDLVKREWKAPDILVNNAGIYTRFGLLEMEFSDWDRVFGVNLRAPFVLSREFAKLMIAEGKAGSIVNISSGAARKMTQNSVFPTAPRRRLSNACPKVSPWSSPNTASASTSSSRASRRAAR